VEEAAAVECAKAAKIKKAQCAARKVKNSDNEDASTEADDENSNPVCH